MSSLSKPDKGIIYILLPVHNRREVTLQFIRCLVQQKDSNYHLVLLDDGSTDGTSEAVQKMTSQVTVLRGEGDWWWGGALQKGYDWLSQKNISRDDIVLLINDDVSFDPTFLENGRQLVSQNPTCQIGAWYLDRASGKLLDRGAGCDRESFRIYPAEKDEDIVFLATRGLFMRADRFIEGGGFIPEKLPHYLSDYEFTFRMAQKTQLRMMTSSLIPVYGLDDQSGTATLENKGPIQALKIIFSKRFRDNPLYISRFVLYCFPDAFKNIHERTPKIGLIKSQA